MTFAIEGIQALLREILETHPAGMSEYDLLKALAGRDVSLFDEDYFNDPHGLFQRHFLLFHCLYQLRDTLRATRQGDIEIHCMGIQLIRKRRISPNYGSIHLAVPRNFAMLVFRSS